MEQIVYVDLFFLINFSMDFLCLFLTSKILNRRLSFGRAILGAAMGGLYADLALFLPFGTLGTVFLDTIVCALMCVAVFYSKGKAKSLGLYILVFVAVSMALGGFMTALFHLLNRSPLAALTQNGNGGDGISVWIFALLAVVSGAITLFGSRFFGNRVGQKNATVEVAYGGKSMQLNAMTDNGNLLREPMSGRPCIVADIDTMAAIFPPELIRIAHSSDPTRWDRLPHTHQKNLRLLPSKTASGSGMLLGVRVDRVTVDSGSTVREVDALIALAELGASAGGNEALLPAVLLMS